MMMIITMIIATLEDYSFTSFTRIIPFNRREGCRLCFKTQEFLDVREKIRQQQLTENCTANELRNQT